MLGNANYGHNKFINNFKIKVLNEPLPKCHEQGWDIPCCLLFGYCNKSCCAFMVKNLILNDPE